MKQNLVRRLLWPKVYGTCTNTRIAPGCRAVRGCCGRGKEETPRCHGARAYVWQGCAICSRDHPVRFAFFTLSTTFQLEEFDISLGATSCYVTEYVRSMPLHFFLFSNLSSQQRGPHLHPYRSHTRLQKARSRDQPLRRFCESVPRFAHVGLYTLSTCAADHSRQTRNSVVASPSTLCYY